MFQDRKFLVSTLIGIAAIVVPWLIAKVDKPSQGLTLRLVSTSSLYPSRTDVPAGIQISVEGVALKDPYLSVLELSNSGGTPIQRADFDRPIQVQLGKAASIVKAQTATTTPSNLNPSLDAKGSTLTVQPLLLNPGDALKLTLLTQGGPPSFSASARISGVREIEYVNSHINWQRKGGSRLDIGLAYALAVLYGLMFRLAVDKRSALPTKLWSAAVALLSVAAASSLGLKAADQLDWEAGTFLTGATVMAALGALAGVILFRMTKNFTALFVAKSAIPIISQRNATE